MVVLETWASEKSNNGSEKLTKIIGKKLKITYLRKMGSSKNIEQDFIIDRLTNSILNTVSGDSFQTEVIRLGKTDLKYVAKIRGWNFNWKSEFDDIKKEVYKLTIVN